MSKFSTSLEDLLTKDDDVNSTGEKLNEKLHELQLQSIEQETDAQAKALGVTYILLKGFPISPEALTLIPKEQSAREEVVCFFYSGNQVRLGTRHPESASIAEIAENLAKRLFSDVEVYLISAQSFAFAMRLYEKIPKARKIIKGVTIEEEELKRFQERIKTFKDLNQEAQKANLTDIVTMVIASAVEGRASDIHIEGEEKDVKVRFRIDGILHDVASLHKDWWDKIVARIKLLASLKINITNKPQDGRFTIYLSDGNVDVRVSTIPTAYGESIVMRLLMSSAAIVSLTELGFSKYTLDIIMREIQRPNGMIITTGPTGSGKTTTMYAVLRELNKPETKILTIEDPIEYHLQGINQSQVDHGRGYTFANGLRSIVRQDPDIILVGEIRDNETTEIAIQAAITGHLVLSTLHTNTAAASIPRFVSMDAKPFLLAPALNSVIGQRLVRRVCESCKEVYALTSEEQERVTRELEKLPEIVQHDVDIHHSSFFHGKGCEVCQGLGYKGRIGIYEVLRKTNVISDIIFSQKVSAQDIEDAAVKEGMITMVQDGLLKVLQGITSVEEVFRVIE